MVATTCKEDGQWSGKKIEAGEGLKTLECLRGRLLAERQASRSAKEEAELMGKKLIELENQIRKETEARNKAERRLKLLMKKLESLNIASTSVTSQNSNSTEISTNSSATKETQVQESRSESLVSTISDNKGEKVQEIIIDNKPNQISPDRTNSSPNSKSRNNSSTDSPRSSQISQVKYQSFSAEGKERENEHYIDKVAASVPGAAPAATKMKMKMKGIHERGTEVPDAVKQHVIRGNVQRPFERRNQMKAIMSM
ncbi:uncharacterized protein LOC111782021 [Cucurbita pepo subsp. pepo]|uniref:uncharacterized protein LOC111782021 n=1 Tax=Cucurbita pepo subsp. pepo TaxID=3664 RepID=UPI000C9D9DE8|nr:uncharacterized protein LOC111782021 [Cucurbita pepo subsp. pepo]XP_023518550.1 uncharacterized protein LOC111782021 [Cucurbita pepo subsp. pepo]XP_023518551.1 uncharacterized protein LOC111782021 [Cucurbita pepo subsp. pepo]